MKTKIQVETSWNVIIPRTTWVTSYKNREGEKLFFTFHCDNCFIRVDRSPERYNELMQMTYDHRCERLPSRKKAA